MSKDGRYTPLSGQGGAVDYYEQLVCPCRSCGVPRMHVQRKPNHRRHLLLTVVTVGFWLPVWVLIRLFQAKPKCMMCGAKAGRLNS